MHENPEASEFEVGDYISILRRRKWWIVGTVVVLVGLSLLKDSQSTPVYRATVQMLLQSKQSENIFQPGAIQGDPDRIVQNELNVINSRATREAAAKAYGSPISVAAGAGGSSDVIVLSATDSNPAIAAKKANVYAEAYQSQRLALTLTDLVAARKVIQQQLNDFQRQIDLVRKPLALIDTKLAGLPPGPAAETLQAQRTDLATTLQPRIDSLQAQLNDYQQRLQILQLSERLTTTGGVQILNPATPPSRPISPQTQRNAIQAAMLGLVLGIGLAFLRDQLDESLRTKSDLERVSRGSEVLGMIPFDAHWRRRDEARIITQSSPLSPIAEAYRGLRTAMQFLTIDQPAQIIQFTSAQAGEGKTSTLANVAIAFAQAGKRVAVVGCDLRRPRIQQFLQVDGSIGLTSVLLGDATLDEALQVSPVDRNISVLASGPRPPNPSELLNLERTASVIRQLLERHSMVLIDAPPALPVTDALVISRFVDSTVVVAMANETSKREVKRVVEMLRQVNAVIAGTVLNGVAEERTYGSLYDYYGYVDGTRKKRPWHRDREAVPSVPRAIDFFDEEDEPLESADPSEHIPPVGP